VYKSSGSTRVSTTTANKILPHIAVYSTPRLLRASRICKA
jgi:hypothetical protein